jgi:hypothetical protein
MNYKKILLYVSLLMFMVFGENYIARATNVMTITGGQVASEGEISIQILIDNQNPFIAFQLDIPLPPQLNYVSESAELNADRANGHSFTAEIISGNILRIISFSLSNSQYSENSGSVASFKLKAGKKPADYDLEAINPIIVGTDGSNIISSAVSGIVTILASEISVTPDTLFYGENPLGSYKDLDFNLINTGNQPLIISGITTNSTFFTVQGSNSFTLDPGGNQPVTIRFNAQEKGDYLKQVTITSNDPENPSVKVSLEANAFAVNELHCGSMVAFSGTKETLSLSINNMEPFVAFQFDLLLPDALAYVEGSAKLSNRKGNHSVSASSLKDNKLRVIAYSSSNQEFSGEDGDIISLDFNVFGTGGWYPINLSNVIITDASAKNILSEYYNGHLEVAAPDIHSQESIDFGDVSILETETRQLQVYNYGSDILIVDKVEFTNTSFFSDVILPVQIGIGNYFDLDISYHKSLSGPQSGSLKIFSNDPDENPYTVSLSANSFTPNYMQVVDVVSFGADSVTVSINVDNIDPFVAFEFKLHYPPEIMEFIPDKEFSHLTNRSDGHELNISNPEPGVLYVFAYSISQKYFLENTGSIVNLEFKVNASEFGIQHPINLTEAILANSQGEDILYSSIDGVLRVQDNVECPANYSICIDASPIILTGSYPQGGDYGGDGVENNVFSPSVAGVGTHTITYIYTRSNGLVSSCEFEIEVLDLPEVHFNNPNPVCVNTEPFLLTGGSPEGGVYSGSGVNNNIFNPALVGVGSYTITYTYTDGNGCENFSNAVLEVNPLPTLTVPDDFAICYGNEVTLTAAFEHGTLTWSNDVENGVAFTPTETTTYTATATSEHGCGTVSESVTATVNPLPELSVPDDFGVCPGDEVTLTVTYLHGTLAWNNDVVNGVAFTPTATKTYSATVTSLYECGVVTESVTIAVNPLPTLTVPDDFTVCYGDEVTLTAAFEHGTLAWSNDVENGVAFTPTETTTYTATVTSEHGCGTITKSVTVTVNPLPELSVPDDFGVCTGDEVTLTATYQHGTLVWNNNVVNGVAFTPIETTTFTATVTSTFGCGEISKSTTVTVSSSPELSVPDDFEVCYGEEVILTATYNIGTISWDFGVQDGVAFIPTETRNYTATVISNCGTVTESVTITVNPLPEVTLAEFEPVCIYSEPFQLSGGSPAEGYYLGNGVNNNVFDPIASGVGSHTITYFYTNSNGCTNSASSELIVNDRPSTPTITLSGTTLTSDAPTGNQWYNQNGIIEGAVNQNYNVTEDGDYYVIVTLLGCNSEPSNTINVVVSGNNTISNNVSIKVYPNPVRGILTLEIIPEKLEKFTLELYNYLGNKVYESSMQISDVYSKRINVSEYPAGVYLLKISSINSTITSRVVIK